MSSGTLVQRRATTIAALGLDGAHVVFCAAGPGHHIRAVDDPSPWPSCVRQEPQPLPSLPSTAPSLFLGSRATPLPECFARLVWLCSKSSVPHRMYVALKPHCPLRDAKPSVSWPRGCDDVQHLDSLSRLTGPVAPQAARFHIIPTTGVHGAAINCSIARLVGRRCRSYPVTPQVEPWRSGTFGSGRAGDPLPIGVRCGRVDRLQGECARIVDRESTGVLTVSRRHRCDGRRAHETRLHHHPDRSAAPRTPDETISERVPRG